ncbi:hypothetical protein GOV12_02095 [Candidatus Pacearchaeota archaeon]|nr:hypothetical protein [Candidatus Pacearchaeota archaeon]
MKKEMQKYSNKSAYIESRRRYGKKRNPISRAIHTVREVMETPISSLNGRPMKPSGSMSDIHNFLGRADGFLARVKRDLKTKNKIPKYSLKRGTDYFNYAITAAENEGYSDLAKKIHERAGKKFSILTGVAKKSIVSNGYLIGEASNEIIPPRKNKPKK